MRSHRRHLGFGRILRAVPGNQHGYTLFSTFLLLLIPLSMATASLIYTATDLEATGQYRRSVKAFSAAESGILHALGTVNARLVHHFKRDIQEQWSTSETLLGSDPHAMTSDSGSGYRVNVEANPTDPRNFGRIIASGWGPLDSGRQIAVSVRKGNTVESPGALYMAADVPVTTSFSGNMFSIDGNDHRPDGTLVTGGAVKPGIATRSDGVTETVVGSLNHSQLDNVRGIEYDATTSPISPSVKTAGGPSFSDINQIVQNIFTDNPTCPPGVAAPTCVVRISTPSVNGSLLSIGTESSPAIIHLTNTGRTSINGNWSGYGILIVEGPLDINGVANFYGWIVAKSGFDSRMNGNATIRGAVWTGTTNQNVGGSLIIDYCSSCLQLADRAGMNILGGNIPRAMEVVLWEEL